MPWLAWHSTALQQGPESSKTLCQCSSLCLEIISICILETQLFLVIGYVTYHANFFADLLLTMEQTVLYGVGKILKSSWKQ